MHAESRPAEAPSVASAGSTPFVWAAPPTLATEDSKPEGPRGGCFDVPIIRGAEIVGLGAYEGTEDPTLSIQGEDHPVGRISVQADPGGNPALLVLSAYDPVVWDFAGFPRNRLRGVLVYGYSSQAVANLPHDVPIRFATRSQGTGPCGSYVHAYEAGDDLEKLDSQVKSVLGVQMSRFYGAYRPQALNVDGGPTRPTAAPSIRKTSLVGALMQMTGLPSGETGLRALIDQGYIRPATQADVNAWNAAAASQYSTSRLVPYRSERLGVRDSFVVLRKTSLPRGMYGAHSRDFIIPSGVPLPQDPGSHNTYYLMASGTCTGSSCE